MFVNDVLSVRRAVLPGSLDENSEFSVPSTSLRMFSSIKLPLSNVSDGHWRCVYSSILLERFCAVVVGHHNFICHVSAKSFGKSFLYRSLKINSKPNMSYCPVIWQVIQLNQSPRNNLQHFHLIISRRSLIDMAIKSRKISLISALRSIVISSKNRWDAIADDIINSENVKVLR